MGDHGPSKSDHGSARDDAGSFLACASPQDSDLPHAASTPLAEHFPVSIACLGLVLGSCLVVESWTCNGVPTFDHGNGMMTGLDGDDMLGTTFWERHDGDT